MLRFKVALQVAFGLCADAEVMATKGEIRVWSHHHVNHHTAAWGSGSS